MLWMQMLAHWLSCSLLEKKKAATRTGEGRRRAGHRTWGGDPPDVFPVPASGSNVLCRLAELT